MKDREASPDNTKHWKLEANLAFSYLTSKKDQEGNSIEFIPSKEKELDYTQPNKISNF